MVPARPVDRPARRPTARRGGRADLRSRLGGAALALAAGLALAGPAAADRGAFGSALGLVAARDWDGAAAAATAAGPVAADVVAWHRLRAGRGNAAEYAAFLRRRPDWPGMDYLRAQGEAALSGQPPGAVIGYFADAPPQRAEGALALVAALQQTGRAEDAARAAADAWATLAFDADDQRAMLALAGPALAGLHVARLDMLLWEGRTDEAERMLPLVPAGWQRLAEARLALALDRPGVDTLIAAVPAELADDPGLAHARFDWRARRDLDEAAIALLTERSASAAALGRPEAWARRRAALVRDELRAGRPAAAYALAAAHHLTEGGNFADLEFLAGFAALRGLNDPDRAAAHFRTLGAAVTTPISRSRAAYWEGRAAEAAGRADAARAAYEQAATYQTAFYGQLAAERLGRPLDPVLLGGQGLPDWRSAAFLGSPVAEAAVQLHRAGADALARRFFLHLAEGLDATALAQLAALAAEIGAPRLAVLVGKQAADRGIILPDAYFPDPPILPEGLAAPRPLALAIARRESEFDPQARSPAGALGLMQVMPGTGRLMAGEMGLPDDPARLASDPAYNAVLGAGYLARLMEEFGPALTLVAAGYNAGPGRPRAWIALIGDPRDPSVDLLDWIEAVPFSETRNYIMRVSEAYVIYRARAAAAAGRPPAPVDLTSILRGTAAPLP